jgi:hypothetical protein
VFAHGFRSFSLHPWAALLLGHGEAVNCGGSTLQSELLTSHQVESIVRGRELLKSTPDLEPPLSPPLPGTITF